MRALKDFAKSFSLFGLLIIFLLVFCFLARDLTFDLLLERSYEQMSCLVPDIKSTLKDSTSKNTAFDPDSYHLPSFQGNFFLLVLDSGQKQAWLFDPEPRKLNFSHLRLVAQNKNRGIIESDAEGNFAVTYLKSGDSSYAFYVALPLSVLNDEALERVKHFQILGVVFIVLALCWTVGDFVRRLRGVKISEVKEQFEEIGNERDKYFQAFHLYFQAFNCAQNGMFIIGKDENIAFVNPAFEELFAYVIGDISGHRLDYLIPTNQELTDLGFDGSNMHAGLIGKMWQTVKDPSIGVWEGELPCKKKNGDIIWVKFSINAVSDISGDIVEYIGIASDVSSAKAQEQKVRLEMYRAISELAERRDNETGQHLVRVSHYSRRLAEEMGMPRKYCQDIEVFSPLHDIGKVGILDSILLAPRRITPEEFEVMKQHSTIGYEILRGKPTVEMAADIAHYHHEKYDGSGYPTGIKGREIPLCARIVAVADVYDALRCQRHYKPGWTHEKAMEEIKNTSGKHFDPQVVEAFLRLEHEFSAFSAEHAEI